MKSRRYITQFYKILPTYAVDQKHLHRRTSRTLYDFDPEKPNYRIHEEHPLKSVTWTGKYGKILLFAVRWIDTYVLSINGRSRLYPKVDGIYKALVNKGAIPATQSLSDMFQNYQMIDLEALTVLSNYECDQAKFDSHATFFQFPSYAWAIEYKDGDICHLDSTSSISYIPFIHEDKVVIEMFLKTDDITDEQRAQLKKEGFKEFTSSYSLSSEAMNEILYDYHF